MDIILEFLSKNMDYVINVCGVIVAVLLVGNFVKLYNRKQEIEDAANRKNTKDVYNKSSGELEAQELKEHVTPGTMREYQKKFNKVVSRYNAWSQLIPIFPLFGILGTVAGLILQMKSDGIDEMMVSLDTALSSTFWGLMWTIGFKIFVAILSARIIEDAEIILDDYDKKLDNSVKLGEIAE